MSLFVPSKKGGLPSVTAEEKQRYDQLFLTLLPHGSLPNTLLSGEKMKEVFLKSGLPPKTLGLIWEKSDVTKDGKMDQKEFAIAMCLIEHVLGGHTIPHTIPQQVLNMNLNLAPSAHTPATAAVGLGPVFSAPAPGGPPGNMAASQPPNVFGNDGFGSSFIPGAPVMQNSLPRTVNSTINSSSFPQSGFTSNFDHPKSTTLPAQPPRMPNRPAMPLPTTAIDAAFGPAPFAPPPVPPARNDILSAWPPVVNAPFAQAAPPRKDSLNHHFGAVDTDWLVPAHSRTKYRQQFALNDTGKTNLMGANVVRNLLLQTKVDTNILARIWDLSNLRGQDNLNPDEFVLAMHLCDMVKAGEPLPPTLPPLLIPPSLRALKSNVAVGVPSDGGALVGQEPQQGKEKHLQKIESFEDKWKQNFDRGEQALEKKREELLAQQRREKEERMEKERQEEERKARERAEVERRRAEQLAEQHRRMEEARKEAEARAQAEHDRRIALSLESRIAAARNHITQLRSQNSQLDSDMQLLTSKKQSLDQQLNETKSSDQAVRKLLHDRNAKYMERRKDLENLQLKLQDFQKNLKLLSDKRMSISEQLKQQATRNPIAERHSQVMSALDAQKRKVGNLKQQNTTAEKETVAKFNKIDLLNSQITQCKHLLSKPRPVAPPTDADQSQTKTTLTQQKAKALESSAPLPFNNETTTKVNDKYNVFADAFKDDPFANKSSDDAGNDLFNSGVDPFSTDPFSTADTQSNDATSATNAAFKGFPADLFEPNAKSPFDSNTFNTPANSFPPPTSAQPGDGTGNASAVNSSQSTTTSAVAAGEQDIVLFEALYDFNTTDEGDLPFKAGDIIRASAEQNLEEAWLAGFLNGVGGWFPQNYTKRITAAVSETDGAAKSPQVTNDSSSFNPQTTTLSHSQPNSLTTDTQSVICKVKVIYEFVAATEGDLTLSSGDEVCVVSKEGDWWTGYSSQDPTKTKGIFPSNFVQVITPHTTSTPNDMSAATAPQTLSLPSGDAAGAKGGKQQELASVIADFQGDSPEQLVLTVGQVVIVKKKLPSGWWEGQVQGEKTKGWFPGDYVRVISSGLTPLPSANSSPERKNEEDRVRAQYAFTGERDDELSFNEGDIITVVSRDDADWWRGELKGQMGLFPSNFVSPL